jgi:hypothetical protein
MVARKVGVKPWRAWEPFPDSPVILLDNAEPAKCDERAAGLMCIKKHRPENEKAAVPFHGNSGF